ncbi:hypothetical protein PASE110613_17275 [Paenibacillus sediminis]|uniref:Uncharacterized protein n=1 Tax=Paenibacillus sediminis TaxID=664909 RepID=A0ABS4H7U7_9BACL|nr:hypothetical protein [Paenibacillus sediminis]MBP1938593.1 hypothetical protein [Paenibacillus sediminis]
MGLKHGREYEHILHDLTAAVAQIHDSYLFLEMEEDEWHCLSRAEQLEMNEALAEDLFYALGSESTIVVGSGIVIHDKEQHRIHFLIGDDELNVVPLI